MCLIHSDPNLRFRDLIHYPEINISEGSFTFLTGKSGCGKSTYLRILNRMILPEEGTVWFGGKKADSFPILEYRREVLLAPQEIFLLDGTVRENFAFYYEARNSTPPSDEQMEAFLQICCAPFSPGNLCTSMSGGERQRVFLAIFLSLARSVLLLDEPTAALDNQTAAALLENLRRYCRENRITVLCVCHNLSLAERFADDIIRLEEK